MRGFQSKRNRYFLTGIVLLFSLASHADDYFWIGGNGNWSDINHWANASGGSILHNTPPSADDDVFFDANSFLVTDQIVTVNTENAVCKTLDWSTVTNYPTFINSTSVNFKILELSLKLRKIGSNFLISTLKSSFDSRIFLWSILK